MTKHDLKILPTVQQYGIQVDNRGWGLCPFHNDKKPSLHVKTDKNRAFCNVCGLGLDPIAFMMLYENIAFADLIKRIENGDKPNKEVIFKHKTKANDEQIVKWAIEVVEDYIYMLERGKGFPVDSVEFALYCHNWDYANFINDSRLVCAVIEGKMVKDYLLALPWVDENMEVLKIMAKGGPILGRALGGFLFANY